MPQQDEQLERAHYERGGLEHKQVEGETEGPRQGGVCACQAVAVAIPLGCPRPGRRGVASYIH